MEAVREITKWSLDNQPNHDYLLDGDRIIAYRPQNQTEVIQLSGKIKIDRRGRKFKLLDPNPFEIKKTKSLALKVSGSKGHSYWVNPEEQTCTCPGFTFRSWCKHLKSVA